MCLSNNLIIIYYGVRAFSVCALVILTCITRSVCTEHAKSSPRNDHHPCAVSQSVSIEMATRGHQIQVFSILQPDCISEGIKSLLFSHILTNWKNTTCCGTSHFVILIWISLWSLNATQVYFTQSTADMEWKQ